MILWIKYNYWYKWPKIWIFLAINSGTIKTVGIFNIEQDWNKIALWDIDGGKTKTNLNYPNLNKFYERGA